MPQRSPTPSLALPRHPHLHIARAGDGTWGRRTAPGARPPPPPAAELQPAPASEAPLDRAGTPPPPGPRGRLFPGLRGARR